MSISTEATVGIVATLLAAIPVGVSALRYWRRRRRGKTSYNPNDRQRSILPVWQSLDVWNHGNHATRLANELATPYNAEAIYLLTSTTTLRASFIRR
ncbi:hypothetical protein BDW71DRAFT_185280 [Aspergillus fruticulosus]